MDEDNVSLVESKYSKLHEKNISFFAILGLYIIAVQVGFLMMFIDLDSGNWKTWFWVIWVAIYAIFVLLWQDKHKWEKAINTVGTFIEDINTFLFYIGLIIASIFYGYYYFKIGFTTRMIAILLYLITWLALDIYFFKLGLFKLNFIQFTKKEK